MATYDEWVSDETTRLTQNMKTAADGIEKLTAFITKASNDIEVLGDESCQLLNAIRCSLHILSETSRFIAHPFIICGHDLPLILCPLFTFCR
jgi:hypothetical protein